MKKTYYDSGDYVIDASHKLPLFVRLRDIALTIIMWGVYLYFMKDLVFFVHDAGIWIYHGFDDSSKYSGLKSLDDVVSLIHLAFLLAATLILWSYYNMLRYGKRKRRSSPPPLAIEQIAARYDIDPHELESWQKARTLIMHHDKDGRLYSVVKG